MKTKTEIEIVANLSNNYLVCNFVFNSFRFVVFLSEFQFHGYHRAVSVFDLQESLWKAVEFWVTKTSFILEVVGALGKSLEPFMFTQKSILAVVLTFKHLTFVLYIVHPLVASSCVVPEQSRMK